MGFFVLFCFYTVQLLALFFHSCVKVGDKECFFHPGFRLILHTKLANPHYKPEIQAQTTLINFTVTRDGLEDQLLAQVVNQERPDLEQLKVPSFTPGSASSLDLLCLFTHTSMLTCLPAE